MKILRKLSLLLLLCAPTAHATIFLGYEFGSMYNNDYENLAGEIGMSLEGNRMLRLVHMDVALSEKHLSSGDSRAVKGDNVEGLWKGYEIFYDMPLSPRFSWSMSAGKYKTVYRHTELDESLHNSSYSVGLAFSVTGNDLLGFKSLYWRVSVPVRYNINAIKETQLGDTTIKKNKYEYNPWIFVGIKF